VKIDQEVLLADVDIAISGVGATKAPGDNLLANSLLKACNEEGILARVLAPLVQASFELGHYLRRFRHVIVIILRKAGKTAEDLKHPSAYRPIALLNATGKLFEVIITKRISDAAEENRLLPELQFGFRAY
jgi:hypothetical protein